MRRLGDAIRRTRRGNRWWLASTALVVLGTAVFALLQWPGTHARAAGSGESPGQTPVSEQGFSAAGCAVGTPIPTVAYDLGSSFQGLSVASREELCNQPPPTGSSVASGPTKSVGYASVIYGECSSASGDGCSPPLEVESWPECARTPNSYVSSESNSEEGGADLDPNATVSLSSAPQTPAASFENGTRIEVYTGTTTIVVVANEPSLASAAANALAAAAASVTPSRTASELQSDAGQPGNASTCTTLLQTSG